MKRWLLAPICAIGVVLMCCGGQASAAGLSPTHLGISVKPFYDQDQYWPRNLSVASGAGIGLARMEADEGTNIDAIVAWLAAAHERLYPSLGLPCPPGTSDCTPQTEIPPGTAAGEMAQYITAFVHRYGPGGTFWSANPKLPYLPVQSFEIGNEPNIRIYWVEDGTHLHWAQPGNAQAVDNADYAEVYEAARSALHKVDPSGVAVVGGLADSASYGVDVESDEALLSALPRGDVDAVGYHPWVYDVNDSLLEPDTGQLRLWMNSNGFSGVPLDVNEFGACGTSSSPDDNQQCSAPQSSSAWGSAVAGYTTWALCTGWLHVRNVQPFVWGGTPLSDADIWLPMAMSDGTVTPYGKDFVSTAHELTTSGCPPTSSAGAPEPLSPPSISGTPVIGQKLTGARGAWSGQPSLYAQWELCDPQGAACSAIPGANSPTYIVAPGDKGSTLRLQVTALNSAGGRTATSGAVGPITAQSQVARSRSMSLRIVRRMRHGRRVTLIIRYVRRSGTVTVTAARRTRTGWIRRVRLRLVRTKRQSARRSRSSTTSTVSFRSALVTGRWTVTVAARPARGFAYPRPLLRRVRIVTRR